MSQRALALDLAEPPELGVGGRGATAGAFKTVSVDGFSDSMMHLYEMMAGKPMPDALRAEAAETARREQRVILLLKPYATFETPPRHVYSENDAVGLTHWTGRQMPW